MVPVCRNQIIDSQTQNLDNKGFKVGEFQALLSHYQAAKKMKENVTDCNVQFHDSSGMEMMSWYKEDNYYDENIFVQTNCLIESND